MSAAAEHIVLRSVAPEESLDAFFDHAEMGFHEAISAGHRANLSDWLDREDTLCAYDGGRLVGASVAFRRSLSVPGAQLSAGAISWISVAPTHRRRGLLSTMMHRQFARLIAHGAPVAALWATEATIYGRFGFGVATEGVSYDIRVRDRDSGIIHPGRALAVRPADPARDLDAFQSVLERVGRQRAGVFTRDAAWWTHHVLADPADDRAAGRLRAVVAGDRIDGYALYRVRRDDRADSSARGVVEVVELVAASSEATQGLWSYVLSIDLVGRVQASYRPPDEPLGALLANPRTAARSELDGLWLRLLDLPRALAARRWNADFDVVLEVQDELLEANAGRWRLSCVDHQAHCVATERPADLSLTVAQLSTIYLGGGSLTRLLDAGLIEERTPGSAAQLDAASRTERAPWAVEVF